MFLSRFLIILHTFCLEKLQLFAISPRHLEACATKTCQVLVEGSYNGILTAGEHFIELKKDFSNIHLVLDKIKEDKQREHIVNRAYKDIVQSGKYSYNNFVKDVMDVTLDNESVIKSDSSIQKILIVIFWRWSNYLSMLAWGKCYLRGAILNPVYLFILNMLPIRYRNNIKKLVGALITR